MPHPSDVWGMLWCDKCKKLGRLIDLDDTLSVNVVTVECNCGISERKYWEACDFKEKINSLIGALEGLESALSHAVSASLEYMRERDELQEEFDEFRENMNKRFFK